jgi:hypothetical protein
MSTEILEPIPYQDRFAGQRQRRLDASAIQLQAPMSIELSYPQVQSGMPGLQALALNEGLELRIALETIMMENLVGHALSLRDLHYSSDSEIC